MSDTHDPIARGARVHRLPPAFRWPGGRHVAVIFNIAYEAWSDGVAPGVGPMGNPLAAGIPDTNAISWGAYGSTRGIHRLMRVLDRTGISASVMVSGILATRTPYVLTALVAGGHEIVAHALAQDLVPARLRAGEEIEMIRHTTALLADAAGRRPTGWISPRGTPGHDTARHLLAAGYEWHGDAFDDDRPYVQQFDDGRIVAVPLTMEINDLPHAMRFGRTPAQFVEAFETQLAYALSAEDDALIIDITAHAHVYGRPSGAWAYEQIARAAAARDDIWLATRGEVAGHVLTHLL